MEEILELGNVNFTFGYLQPFFGFHQHGILDSTDTNANLKFDYFKG
jgi:hypothetical protein